MCKAFIVVTLLLVGQRVQAAECPPGTSLQVIGQVQVGATTSAATDLVSSSGRQVRMITQTCGSTACAGTSYDADGNGDVVPTGTGYVNANVKAEHGAPANESRTYPYDPPLAFVNGISVHNIDVTNATLFYECRP